MVIDSSAFVAIAAGEPARRACSEAISAAGKGKQQRKRFFFEKKNQKTFTNSG
jgi:hypothetical protein